ncbi:MAG TPA: hypothetical protein DDZ51_25970, partial [Planctomycetaceae bacterium]|nr:hypothetical protein [Planctomycetaceae bacterium]
VDEEYFRSEGASKKLTYVNDCHLRAFAEAFGEATDALDDSFVTRNCLKIGRIDSQIFTPCEPMVVTRVDVTPTSIPGALSELDNVLIRSVNQLGFK